MSELVYTVEDKQRVREQVSALWAKDMSDCRLVAIRFDQSPLEDSVVLQELQYPHLALVYIEDGEYTIAWGECSFSEDGLIQFTEDDWEYWSESGEEPWRGDLAEYTHLVADVYPDHPEWEHMYL